MSEDKSGSSTPKGLEGTGSSSRSTLRMQTRLCVEGKVVVVGDMAVGKTCVVARFTKDGALAPDVFDSLLDCTC